MEAPERNATRGHTTEIGRPNVCTPQQSVVPFVQKRRFFGEGSTEPVGEMTSDDIPAH